MGRSVKPFTEARTFCSWPEDIGPYLRFRLRCNDVCRNAIRSDYPWLYIIFTVTRNYLGFSKGSNSLNYELTS